MFPYTFPNLIILWTLFIFLQQDSISHGLATSIGNNYIFIVPSLLAVYYFYGKTPKKRTDKARAIAFNVAILPLLFINSIFMVKVISGDSIGSSGLAYLLPMIYSPVIFIVVLIISYFFIKEESE